MKTDLCVPETGGDDEGCLPVLIQLVDLIPLLHQLFHLLKAAGPGGLAEVPLGASHLPRLIPEVIKLSYGLFITL